MVLPPGPWRVGPINYADVYDAEGQVVALVPKGFEWTVNMAQAITQYPDVLYALKDLLSWTQIAIGGNPEEQVPDHPIRLAFDAIAKAEGR